MRIHFDPVLNPFPSALPLPKHLNEFIDDGVEFVPIALFDHKSLNMKLPVAVKMLETARLTGKLKGVHTIIEATSGNTGVALGMIAPYYGIREVVAVVNRDIAPGKLELLRFFGVQPEFPALKYRLSTIQEARRLAREGKGCFNPDQYKNTDNWKAHFENTGPHVWEQTGGKISVFCAALGTTGTVVGVSKFLRLQERGIGRKIWVVGAALKPEHAIPGVRTVANLQPNFNWSDAINARILVGMKNSYLASRNLCLAGYMYGPSSGVAFDAARQFISKRKRAGALDGLRNEDKKIVVGFACGDTPLLYLDKYSKDLDPEEMEPINPARVQD